MENKKPQGDSFKVPVLPVGCPLQFNTKANISESKEPTPAVLKNTNEKKNSWTITDFVLGRMLNKGQFCTVYRAREKESQHILSLKVLFKRHILEAGIEHQVRREVEIHCRLRHPNILRMYGQFDDAERIYIILENASRGTLKLLLEQHGPFDEKTAAIYIRDITKALFYCHNKKIIHRNINPDNILIGHKGQPMIADFGCSVRSKSSQRLSFCGSLDYLSPEMFDGKPHNYAIDIWSLGVLCYELLLWQPLFDSEIRKVFLKVSHAIIKYAEYVSKEAKDLMGKLLVVNPENRLPLKSVLQHPWILENAPKVVHPPVFSSEKLKQNDKYKFKND